MITPVQNFVRIDIGKNSAGKTPTQIFDLTAYQKVYPWKKYIVSEGQDRFSEAHARGDLRIDLLIPKNNEKWAEQLQEFTEPTPGNKIYTWDHSVLVIDDIKLLLKGFDTPSDFLGLFALRPSQKFNMQMMLNCHEPRNIPEGIKGYISHFHIYANEAEASQYENKISCHLQCKRASLVVNEYERLYPGYYDLKTHTPYFPSIMVIKDKPEPMHFINMDPVKLKPILDEFTKQSK